MGSRAITPMLAAAALLVCATPRPAWGQQRSSADGSGEAQPSWSWPVELAGAPAAFIVGMTPPEQPGEPLGTVALQSLSRWRALEANIVLSAAQSVATAVDTSIGCHGVLAWGTGVVRPGVEVDVAWSAEDSVALRGGPILEAAPGGPQLLMAVASYQSDVGDVRMDVVYSLALGSY